VELHNDPLSCQVTFPVNTIESFFEVDKAIALLVQNGKK